ncbi:XTP/dITP diphosphatase [Parageobacillus thermoglucosidasius]|jgi:XTP/dITP diphosphohydrolase|uniref:dITP/XTP pyrophosphatase n=3 Tax=Anoxybacillaceae TaxID=3120669 RepID=A0AB38QYM8_PARTM|nr:XTP/dITP diphosphatase [Parageobacillus thermoglucosidasius]KYD13966.1 Nucleoside 5-triphosphatase RdgB (dHAPTP, dITP, XTP-specific) [Anoxybacillus flavithermus]REK55808.1 MAG: XTP/dITP diphosphatase [Geobacillus sp.]AEH46974.1 Nucleoside-triphosphatase rdgB [Parageobacillus thermoglucosidasius C56-YS93]ALF11717.1 non-canonical purine NTP pyrophosphatase [Parageobacillus thermoglucosidasius]ANZ31800.1 non-canonical purine NTP pyrophosphatase [Parageobacillus thermoglucosidasius]
MKQVIIATKNAGKTREFQALLAKKGVEVKSLLDFPDCPDVEETGSTFAENAILKAEAMARYFHTTVIADDSGLAIDALHGRPGVYSARYAGEEKDDQKNIAKVLEELKGVPLEKRTARFHCALAVAAPGRRTAVVEATCEGYIAEEPKGENGFGYDPIFYVPQKGKTMAELSKEEKNQISHRAKALAKLEEQWDEIINDKE